MEDIEAFKNLCRNAWNMGLREMCEYLGLDRTTDEAQDQFRAFQSAAQQLQKLNPQILAMLARKIQGQETYK